MRYQEKRRAGCKGERSTPDLKFTYLIDWHAGSFGKQYNPHIFM